MPRELNLDRYLSALRDGHNHLDGAPAHVDAAFDTMSHAVAVFIDVCRATEGLGYAYGRMVMEEMTHMFPMPPRPADNGAVKDLGGGMAVVDLTKATDDQLRDISLRAGIPFEQLKAAQAAKRAMNAPESTTARDAIGNPPAPADNTPASGTGVTDWAAMEAQFNDDPEAA